MVQEPILLIEQGKLRGKIATDYRGGQYFSFQGIPYAKPPIQELRFKAPRPPEPWSGIRDATAEGNVCYHRHWSKKLMGSEDCLFLNVYTGELPTKDTILKPVMVWIHGGGFKYGSGDTDFYGPNFLVAEDVVIVTINYRLGLLGFLSFEDPSLEVPGNAGLKDQVAALKWVQKNIANFGGDCNNVTVFGQSTGGASVHYLMLSPMAKDLFHRGIIQSGTALDSWIIGQPSAPIVANALKLKTSDETVVLNILKKMSVEELHRLQESLPDVMSQHNLRSFGVVIEHPSNHPAFLTERPIDIIRSGRFKKVPLIIGYTSREGMFFEMTTKSKFGKMQFEHNLERITPYILKLQEGSDLSKKVAAKIKNFYYGDEEPSIDNIDQYYMLETDTNFLCTIYYAIKQHMNVVSSSLIYFYRMSVDSSLNLYKKIGKLRNSGVCHCDDLSYLFKTEFTPKIRPGSIEDESIRRFSKLWTTFAKNGDPNPVDENLLINVRWKPVQKGQFHYLDIGENLTVGINPDGRRMAFWNEIFEITSIFSKL